MPPFPDSAVFQERLAALPVATYQAGETVFAAGSRTGRLLILRKGAVVIVKEDVEIAKVAEPGAVFGELSVLMLKVAVASQSGGERILAFLGPGAIVGEMSIIDGRPRSASVVAVRQAALKFLSRAAFEEFTRDYPEVYKYLVKLLASH
jgi:CRP-like cAMP-binding protein